ncbi:MAG TPA: NrsF family protein [Polyangia bacterium]
MKTRTLAAARATRSPPRQHVQFQNRAIVSAAIALTAFLFVAVGAVRPAGRPWSLVLGTATGAAMIAAATALVLTRAGNRMLGPAKSWLLAPALAAPAAFLIWKLSFTSQFAGMMEPWPARPGIRCLLLTFALALTPLSAVLFVRRRSDPLHPELQGFAWGIALGMTATVLADLWCPVAHLPHLLGGHIAPIVLLGVAGFIVGGAALGLRPPQGAAEGALLEVASAPAPQDPAAEETSAPVAR